MGLFWEYDGRDGSKTANYRGHTISITYDLDAENPREFSDCFKFISVNKAETTPDNCKFRPVGNFYIDIYRYAVDEWGIMRDWDRKDLQRAYNYVSKNLMVFPVGFARYCQSNLTLFHTNAPTIEQTLDGSVRQLFGAIFIPIKKAKELYGADKTIEELYDIIRPEVGCQLGIYSLWANGEVNYIDVEPSEKILFLLSVVGGTADEIAVDWQNNSRELCRQIWGDCATDSYEVAQCIQEVDKQVDWLVSELDKLDSSQLNPTMKANLLELLSKQEEEEE